MNLIPGDYATLLTLLENTTKGDFEFSIFGASSAENLDVSHNQKKKDQKAEAKKGKKGK